MRGRLRRAVARVVGVGLASLGFVPAHAATLKEGCVVSILNRSAQVRADGSWVLPNVPANIGQVRARATCVDGGRTTSGQSPYFVIPANGIVDVPEIVFGQPSPVPARLTVETPSSPLTTAGATAGLVVRAVYADGSDADVTLASTGTNYTSSNPAVATVSAGGLVTGLASGTVLVTALNDGAVGFGRISVVLGGDTDGDGISDDIELANGLNPNDPVDALEDFDRDGLTNRSELQLAPTCAMRTATRTRYRMAARSSLGTDPLVFDTDGDGLGDGLEVATGSDPLDPTSYNLALALQSLEVTPPAVSLVFNTMLGEASRQLKVIGNLIDGRTLDLTSRQRRTNYASSDLTVVSFGAVDGQIFAGAQGSATVTVSNSGFTAFVPVSVRTFAPTPLSVLMLPGFANNVEVAGDYAYVSSGPAGLLVVGVSDRRAPQLVHVLALPGNANDIRLRPPYAYVASGSAGLHVVDISNPHEPVLVASLDTPGDAIDLALGAEALFIADGPAGVQVVSIADPAHPEILGSLDTEGSANGVDASGTLLAVSNYTAAPDLIDVSALTNPLRLGSASLGSGILSYDVRLIPPHAYLTTNNDLRVVDVADPQAPRFVGSFGAGIWMKDLERAGPDLLFTTQVRPDTPMPIFRLGNPAAPQFTSSIIFSTLPGAQSGDGIGLASDARYVYMTATRNFEWDHKPGTHGETKLLIGQYLELTDDQGRAPTVTLISPVAGAERPARSTLTLWATAQDDMAVASVTFLVEGVPVFTDGAPPYTFDLVLPAEPTTVTFGAVAVDFGDNQGRAEDVTITVIPDAFPTVSLITPAEDAILTEGLLVQIEAAASDNIAIAGVSFTVNGQALATARRAPYRAVYSIAPGTTRLDITAVAQDNLGQSATASRSVPVIPDAPPSVALTAPPQGASFLEGELLRMEATASDNRSVTQVAFSVNGLPAGIDFTAPYEASFVVPGGVTELEIAAEATDDLGRTTRDTRTVQVRTAGAVLHVEPARLDFVLASPTATLETRPDARAAATSTPRAAGQPSMVSAPSPIGSLVGPPARSVPPQPRATPTVTSEAASRRIVRSAPIRFEPNLGQADPAVRFLARGPGYAVFLTPDEVVLALPRSRGASAGLSTAESARRPSSVIPGRIEADVLRMKLRGAAAEPRVSAHDALPSRSHYLHGNDPARWRTNVPHYGRVEYQEVYPGVSLAFYGDGHQLEYDFVVEPGADPSLIELAFEGACDVDIDAQGHLLLATEGGELRQLKPVVYQTVDGVRRPLEGRYVRAGEKSVRFALGEYDSRLALVIDPVLTYSTYLGGTNSEAGTGIAVDGAGNAYVTGYTSSTDFPVVNAYQPTLGSALFTVDAFVTKIAPEGGGMVFSTYLGGARDENANDIAVGADGSVYLVGLTSSPDFPTMNPLRGFAGGAPECGYPVPGTCPDAFVARLSPDGSSLVFSTYVGGTRAEIPYGVALDASGTAYVTGATNSANFPTSTGALQPAIGGGFCPRGVAPSTACFDAFLFNISADGSALGYSTYMGRFGKDDDGRDVAVDIDANAYVTGTGDPVPSSSIGADNAFVVKLGPSGNLVYLRGLGGSRFDAGLGIALDPGRNAYVMGYTLSTDFLTVNAFQPAPQPNNGPHYFVTKLDPTGTQPLYSSYLGGGSEFDLAGKIAVDSFGNAYVAGITHNALFPVLNPLEPCGHFNGQATLTKVDATGSALVYSTCFGRLDVNSHIAVAVDADGAAYLTGAVGADDFPTLRAIQPTYGGQVDAFVTKISTRERYQFASSHYAVVEGTGEAELTVRRIDRGNFPTSVGYMTVNGSATAPADYSARTGTLDFAYGETSKTLRIPIAADALVEADETLRVVLTGATGGAIVAEPGTATVTIVNEDREPPPGVLTRTLVIRDESLTTGPTWQATTNEPWIGLSATDGTGPSTVTVTVDPAGLAFGVHSGAITITAGAAGSPKVVPVSLRIGEAYALEPSALRFVHTAGTAVAQATPGASRIVPRTAAKAEEAGAPPLAFEPNVGQASSNVAYLSRGRGYGVFLGRREVSLVLAGRRSPGGEPGHADSRPAAITMSFAGASIVEPVAQGEQPGRSHYLLGRDTAQWRRDVPHYSAVRYPSLYPGVDAVFYGREGRLEYDLVVRPDADLDRVAIRFQGIQGLSVDGGGDLLLEVPGGHLVHRRPVVWEDREGTRVPLEGRYVRTDDRTIGFRVEGRDRRWPVVIDPVLSYSTYLGGTDTDVGMAVGVDPSGHVYVGGDTVSADFPTHAAVQPAIGSLNHNDAFVTKIKPDGTLAFSTYLGGSQDDGLRGLAVDTQGNVYVTGWTSLRRLSGAGLAAAHPVPILRHRRLRGQAQRRRVEPRLLDLPGRTGFGGGPSRRRRPLGRRLRGRNDEPFLRFPDREPVLRGSFRPKSTLRGQAQPGRIGPGLLDTTPRHGRQLLRGDCGGQRWQRLCDGRRAGDHAGHQCVPGITWGRRRRVPHAFGWDRLHRRLLHVPGWQWRRLRHRCRGGRLRLRIRDGPDGLLRLPDGECLPGRVRGSDGRIPDEVRRHGLGSRLFHVPRRQRLRPGHWPRPRRLPRALPDGAHVFWRFPHGFAPSGRPERASRRLRDEARLGRFGATLLDVPGRKRVRQWQRCRGRSGRCRDHRRPDVFARPPAREPHPECVGRKPRCLHRADRRQHRGCGGEPPVARLLRAQPDLA